MQIALIYYQYSIHWILVNNSFNLLPFLLLFVSVFRIVKLPTFQQLSMDNIFRFLNFILTNSRIYNKFSFIATLIMRDFSEQCNISFLGNVGKERSSIFAMMFSEALVFLLVNRNFCGKGNKLPYLSRNNYELANLFLLIIWTYMNGGVWVSK